ncbi:tautomerase family protein [Deinococcus ruber]|uniref:Tautomerase n=1 Tax=Deinococcus ruber TaxID=1848197 RepID=A0A918BUG0_9DEIO|nr:tautomerase family protein [Deinococcus ruber]GGQ92734.1 tautomerase [Deinococcus ruber]
MTQVKIYALRSELEQHRQAISDSIHAALTDVLGLPPEKKFQRFFPLEAADFVFPADRSVRYTILELQMFEGRRPETRHALIRELQRRWVDDLNSDPADLEIILVQTPAEGWGIRGSLGHELTLNYEVNV